MAGVIAVPFAIILVWFPREIDQLGVKVDAAVAAAELAAENSKNASDRLESIDKRMDALVESMARFSALPGSLRLMAFFKEALPEYTYKFILKEGYMMTGEQANEVNEGGVFRALKCFVMLTAFPHCQRHQVACVRPFQHARVDNQTRLHYKFRVKTVSESENV